MNVSAACVRACVRACACMLACVRAVRKERQEFSTQSIYREHVLCVYRICSLSMCTELFSI